MCAELLGEPVERVHGRAVTNRGLKHRVLCDQPGSPAPGGEPVQALGEAGADQRADRVALPARPAEPLKLRDQPGDLG